MVIETVLVTGSKGFVGSHFCDLLHMDERYIVKEFVGDITDQKNVIRNLRQVDTVVNFAAFSFLSPVWDAPVEYANVNFEGVLRFMVANKLFKRFIQMSTALVYGSSPVPHKLGDMERPTDVYGVSKLAAEKAIIAYSNKYGFDYLILRNFNIFGPRQSPQFVIPSFIRQALETKKINVYGNTQRDFVYVKDVVKAMKNLLDVKATGYRQICHGEPQYVADVATRIAKILGGVEVILRQSNRPIDLPRVYGVPDMKEGLEFTDMDDALTDTIFSYRDSFNIASIK